MAYQSSAFYLFNCDNTYNLEIVERFLLEVEKKYGVKVTVDRHYFKLQQMTDLCERTLPQLVTDFAIFVVHADESRLSINEDNAGIGYARIYRALLEKTDNKVLIVIGGDSNYRDEDEKARSVISRWAKRKVASQFDEEYLDGRKSFIFSWDEKHRPIHEQAMLHFLDPSKRGFTFEYTPPTPLPKPIAPVVPQPSRKSEAPKVLARPAIPYSRLEDDEEESRTHTREAPTRKLRDEPPKGNYEGMRPAASGTAPAVYPAGTRSLHTHNRGTIQRRQGCCPCHCPLL